MDSCQTGWPNVEKDLGHRMASLAANELKEYYIVCYNASIQNILSKIVGNRW